MSLGDNTEEIYFIYMIVLRSLLLITKKSSCKTEENEYVVFNIFTCIKNIKIKTKPNKKTSNFLNVIKFFTISYT